MIRAYFDDSGTHAQSPIVVAAGVLISDEQHDLLKPAWQQILSRQEIRESAGEQQRDRVQGVVRAGQPPPFKRIAPLFEVGMQRDQIKSRGKSQKQKCRIRMRGDRGPHRA